MEVAHRLQAGSYNSKARLRAIASQRGAIRRQRRSRRCAPAGSYKSLASERPFVGARLRAMEVAHRLQAGSHNSKARLRATRSPAS
jgi:hypothetical protein